jgi:hypothetical protein
VRPTRHFGVLAAIIIVVVGVAMFTGTASAASKTKPAPSPTYCPTTTITTMSPVEGSPYTRGSTLTALAVICAEQSATSVTCLISFGAEDPTVYTVPATHNSNGTWTCSKSIIVFVSTQSLPNHYTQVTINATSSLGTSDTQQRDIRVV